MFKFILVGIDITDWKRVLEGVLAPLRLIDDLRGNVEVRTNCYSGVVGGTKYYSGLWWGGPITIGVCGRRD